MTHEFMSVRVNAVGDLLRLLTALEVIKDEVDIRKCKETGWPFVYEVEEMVQRLYLETEGELKRV